MFIKLLILFLVCSQVLAMPVDDSSSSSEENDFVDKKASNKTGGEEYIDITRLSNNKRKITIKFSSGGFMQSIF